MNRTESNVAAARERIEARREEIEKEFARLTPGEVVALARAFADRLPWGKKKAMRGWLANMARAELDLRRKEKGL